MERKDSGIFGKTPLRIDMIRVMKKLGSILSKRQRKIAVLLGILMLIGGVVDSFGITMVLPLLTAITNTGVWNDTWYAKLICNVLAIDNQRAYIQALLLILAVVFIFKNLFLLLEYYLQYSITAKWQMKTQQLLMQTYMRKPYEFFLSASTGEIMRIIQGDVGQAFSLLSTVLGFYTEAVSALFVGITVLVISPHISWGLFVLLGVEMFIISVIIKPIMKRIGDGLRNNTSLASKWLLQAVNGIKSIKVSHTESFFEEKYNHHTNKITEIGCKYNILTNAPRLMIEAFTLSGVLVIVYTMVFLGVELTEIVPQLSAIAFAAMRLLPSANRMSAAINNVPYYEGGLDNVILTLENENRYDEHEPKCTVNAVSAHTAAANISFSNKLQFSHISFAYSGSDEKIFDDSSFEILPGQSVGIVGTSGAGKTTAIDIILGLLKPSAGKILSDGTDIEENMASWLSHLAYIPQNIFLTDDTIRANVGFGMHRREIDDERVMDALREAQLEKFVKSLPEGIDTKVGEQGVRLSGGQRQRIGIARALYSNPDILVFDEATSALDNETEAAIMESINNLKGQKTLIVIAHRLTTIENCDVVFRVENGSITRERG